MTTTIQYLIVPAWSDQAGQCRIVRREHEVKHPDPLQHYRQYPQQWQEAGIMNSRGVVVALDASPEVLREFRDCEPLMAGTSLAFPAQDPGPLSLAQADEVAEPPPGALADLTSLVAPVAADFALLLEAEIGVDGLRMVVELNSAEPSPHVCHSHDFCDPNMLMAAAIRRRSGCNPVDEGVLLDNRFQRLWSDAWDVAKSTFFCNTTAAKQALVEYGADFAELEKPHGADTSSIEADVSAP